MEDTPIGSEPDVDAFSQLFLGLFQHHTKEDGEECGHQHAALFHTISNFEGVGEIPTVCDLTLLAFLELLDDGEEL